MKAVILSAGLGTRMGSEIPKPLVRLFGMPVIEHTIRKLKGHDVIVVYHREEIREYLERKFPDIEFVYNPHPERENGYSLYLARKLIDGDFLLLMSDHYYGENFFSQEELPEETTVFVSNYCHDPEEATRVKVRDDRVVRIGKKLEDYDYFDTGFFYCTREVFEVMEKVEGNLSVSEVISELAKRGRVGFRVVNHPWIDIDTPEDLKIAEKLVRKSLMKDEDGYVSRHLNRKISTALSKVLIPVDLITPNVMTLISFFTGIISSVVFVSGNPLAGGVLAQICSVIDGCDGEIARIKNLRSEIGGVLDSITDRYADVLIFTGMMVFYGYSGLSILAYFLALSGAILVSYSWHLTGKRTRIGTRDIRLFIVMIGGIMAVLYRPSILIAMFVTGILAHSAVWLSFLSFRRDRRE